MWFVYWITSVYIITFLINYAFQKRLKEMKDSYVKLTKAYYKESKVYKDAYDVLQGEYSRLFDTYKKTSGNMHINDDIKSALKFAMIYSHPDKGNCKNADEFIKFKKLYDTYK